MMRILKNNLEFIVAFGLIFLGFASFALGQDQRASRDLLNKINIKFSEFDSNLNRAINRDGFSRQDEDEINELMNGLDKSLDAFDKSLQAGQDTSAAISDVLSASGRVDQFLGRFKWDAMVLRSWAEFRRLSEKLSSGNNLPADNFPQNGRNGGFQDGLNGTYRIDLSRSDNARLAVEDATRGMSDNEREAALRHLEEKLDSPDSIAIETRGKTVAIASSKSPQASFEANGRERIERGQDGRNIRVRSDLRDGELTISIEQEAQRSSRLRDFSYVVIFTSMDNGSYLRVVRRLTDDEINQTFVVTSIYEKISDIAQLDIYNNQGNYPNTQASGAPSISQGRRGEYIVENGTILTGILETDITTKTASDGDKFRMTIHAPREWKGAVVEGYVSGINRSGRATGSSKLTLNFQTIILRNGERYDFAGFLQSITDTNGKNIKIDEEGTARGKSQTKETAKRGGIGAGAGAIIGAIIGGVKGAVIGAGIGAGAGAGTVIIQGKDDLKILAGSSITVQSSSPIRSSSSSWN